MEHGHGRSRIRQLHGLQLAHAEAAALVDEAAAAERRLPERAGVLPWRAHQLLQLPAGDGLQQLLQAPTRSALQESDPRSDQSHHSCYAQSWGAD